MPSCGYSAVLALTGRICFPLPCQSRARSWGAALEPARSISSHSAASQLNKFLLFSSSWLSPPRVLLIKIWFCWCFQGCHPLCYEAENCHSGGWVQLSPASKEAEGIRAGDLLFLSLCSGHRQVPSDSPVKLVLMLLLQVECHREGLKMA